MAHWLVSPVGYAIMRLSLCPAPWILPMKLLRRIRGTSNDHYFAMEFTEWQKNWKPGTVNSAEKPTKSIASGKSIVPRNVKERLKSPSAIRHMLYFARKTLDARECIACSKLFYTHRSWQKFCSKQCRCSWHNERLKNG